MTSIPYQLVRRGLERSQAHTIEGLKESSSVNIFSILLTLPKKSLLFSFRAVYDVSRQETFDSLNMWLEEVEQFASGAGRGQKYGELLYFVRALTFFMPYFPAIFLPQMFCAIRGSKTSRWE